jgi:tetratricopeptide (TPR) repeat protein
VEAVAHRLAETYLIDTEPAPVGEPVRYRFHELVRPFARERLLTEESGAERREALERLLGALLFLALAAHRREYSGDNMLPSGEVGVWPLPDEYADRLLAEPLAWFERERSVLVGGVLQAAASGLSAQAWNLALCAVTLFESHSYFADWRQTHESALRAAVAAGDRRGEAAMRYSLGSLELFEQLNEAAAAHLEAAREIFTELGDRHGAGHALRNIAVIDRRDGRLDEAIERGGRALRMLREAGDRVGEAHTLHNLAHARLDQGSDEVARGLLDSAAQICAEVGNRRVYAQVQRQLGELNLRRGELESAAECFRRVLEIVLETDDKVGQCYALIGLANVDIRRGRPEQALRILREVAQTTAAIGNPLLDDRVGLALAQAEGRSAGVGAPEDQVAGAGRADARDGRDGRDSAVTRESRAT